MGDSLSLHLLGDIADDVRGHNLKACRPITNIATRSRQTNYESHARKHHDVQQLWTKFTHTIAIFPIMDQEVSMNPSPAQGYAIR